MLEGVPRVGLVYRLLGIGLVALGTVFALLSYLGVAPLLDLPDDTNALFAYVMSAVTGVLIVVAVLVLKPGVPERRGSQSVQEYWSTPAAQRALLVWFVLEGAGTLSLMGFLLTGETAAAVAAGVAMVAYWRVGPGVFART